MRYAQLWLTHFNSYLVFIAFFYMNTSHLGNLGFYFFLITNAAMNFSVQISWGHV